MTVVRVVCQPVHYLTKQAAAVSKQEYLTNFSKTYFTSEGWTECLLEAGFAGAAAIVYGNSLPYRHHCLFALDTYESKEDIQFRTL
ncbi:hypothetical protein sscle_04g035130 [Sclerotinia sclerotiorum 1980 UF-70]|uniref:Uncharacterized protein n=1 Tax=Sclerotinia sclerotiorum (strain ATCC 18683 / 1980 / Ss-1) TaxID=665079 RepID=A0A1D9Q2G4_SCLS1|nr:hypothetical protein sscle_04g035130 [Sclerotinia sclerotiorum 1980 UF-70]